MRVCVCDPSVPGLSHSSRGMTGGTPNGRASGELVAKCEVHRAWYALDTTQIYVTKSTSSDSRSPIVHTCQRVGHVECDVAWQENEQVQSTPSSPGHVDRNKQQGLRGPQLRKRTHPVSRRPDEERHSSAAVNRTAGLRQEGSRCADDGWAGCTCVRFLVAIEGVQVIVGKMATGVCENQAIGAETLWPNVVKRRTVRVPGSARESASSKWPSASMYSSGTEAGGGIDGGKAFETRWKPLWLKPLRVKRFDWPRQPTLRTSFDISVPRRTSLPRGAGQADTPLRFA